jgi:cation diffusion facilitator family transporter
LSSSPSKRIPLSGEESERIGYYSIAINILLVGIKYGLALFSGSIALVADAIHSLSDVISSTTVLVGIKISKRKSRIFPYGLYKVENLVSLASSLFIFLAGYEIAASAFSGEEQLNSERLPMAMGGVLLTILITFLFSRYELRRGREIESPSLTADAQHIRTDMLSSGVIFFGLLGGMFRLPLDRVAALVMVFFIGKAGLAIFLDAIRVLLDASLDFETLDRVKNTILEDPKVVTINALWGRNSGRFKFIEADIVLKVHDLDRAHAVTKRIEGEIKKRVSNVDHILIHYEPQKKETRTCVVPLAGNKRTISDHFGDAPYFYLATLREGDKAILEEKFLHNPFLGEEKGKGIKVSEWLLQHGADTVLTRRDFKGRGPGYVFSDAGVDVHLSEGESLEEVVRLMKSLP